MTRLRKAVLDWVERTVVAEWPQEQKPDELAETLVSIGEHFQVPDEVLIQWLHLNAPCVPAWRRCCEEYVETRKRIFEAAEAAPEQRTLLDLPRPPSGFDPR